ncbi:ubiquinone/menaquinone biosynthesis C-methylase UbiE [Halopolyspora algeriensis]|uniref:Ubiquinone/menaquinone biosynthesis C-methylase UbiE n=1 Tax=Halopolyspora algeriensis TaxID=1500506 RepID=A0A368VVH7_9ACTN|nr:class I SAM-dependent methyltransferase [Halopolyspora algeriensis]RCW44658.1 ubiquinone/menaquinone biosynthesis C-methylase UbiE [Halopolyspora algeriensis]TQM56019.1 ubiquinone/menaquinone biosynthesis C-methylase UbiE [Halopolyspora algeriensis]
MNDVVYDRIGVGYTRGRRPDPRWQAALDEVLGEAGTIVNVGAGTGSYEPAGRYVLAVEPSATMIAQRPSGAAPALCGHAEELPIADGQFDVAMALVTLHHWQNWAKGLRELQRVARRVVVLHFDPVVHSGFWLVTDYLPELADVWRDVPRPQEVAAALGPATSIRELPVPRDCVDGFLPAYWRRPEAYLDPGVRRSMSGLQLLDSDVLARGVAALRSDLNDGTWQRRNAALLDEDQLDVGWRLIFTE